MDISHIPLTVSTSLGELLRFLRRRARLSQRELSIAVGYSESHISRIENNERPVDRASLLALFVPALEIENEPETIARLLALCEQAQPLPAATLPAPVPSRPGAEPQPAPPNRLPVQLTSFIGRAEELAELRELLADDQTRLLTLTGAGGCGKTRLALRVGEEMAQAYRHGVWLVELAALTDPRLLVREVVSTFDLQENAERPLLAALTDFLRPRQALLILDNCEHLVEEAARLAAALLPACPDLRILATSRENLAVPGEIVYPVQPLALPPALRGGRPGRADVEGYDAIRLFVERARAALRGFALSDQNAPAVARICQRLDGIPLGIELAAAWLPLLSPKEIAARLERNLDLPAGGRRTLLPRHQTLAAAIAWSYHLLSGEEQALLRRLSIFGGDWSLEAAEEIAGELPPLTQADVLGLLRRLINKSLVTVERSAEGGTRYRFLEAIREFARQRLAESGEEAALADRHLAWFVTLAERAEPRLKSAQQLFWLAALDQEQENLRAALSHSLARGSVEEGLRLVGALGHFWEMRYHLVEGGRWGAGLLDAAQGRSELIHSPWRAKALFTAGMIAACQFEDERARVHLEESVRIYRELGDAAGAGAALCFIAITQDRLQQPQQALDTYHEAIRCSQRAEDTWWIAEHLH